MNGDHSDTDMRGAVAARDGDGDGGRALALHLAIGALLALAATIVWGAVGGFFWPMWVWVCLLLTAGLHASVLHALPHPPGRVRALVLHADATAVLAVYLLLTWACGGAGAFWPIWPYLGLGLALALHAVIAFPDRLPWSGRTRVLSQRVDELTRTRRGALDEQAAQLRKIERDLHDGAQARLVALTMQLGRAEARLEDRPEVAQLLRRARDEAGAAIAELRDLARGIAPPVLADRGLAAAVEALAKRASTPVTTSVEIERRQLPVVEAAAYFVVAEALTNVAKHAPAAAARVTIRERGGSLRIEVADDGPGGAVDSGNGLTGLRHRVQALDGMLAVQSPPGGGTIVRAELPCGS